MKLLITGGAGYIGSHIVWQAQQAGHECVAIDNLSTGVPSRVDCEVAQIDLASEAAVTELEELLAARFDAVIHLAARKQVGESVEKPELYFKDNIGGLANLLIAMRNTSHNKLVFSSSAATYGMPDQESVSEDDPAKPINPYGQTKLVGEWMVSNAKQP
jgi:UDP-glucose 4-epimerase